MDQPGRRQKTPTLKKRVTNAVTTWTRQILSRYTKKNEGMNASRQFERSIVWSQVSLALIGRYIRAFSSGTVRLLAILNGDLNRGSIILNYESILTAIVFFQIS